jgi:hypothetical protein
VRYGPLSSTTKAKQARKYAAPAREELIQSKDLSRDAGKDYCLIFQPRDSAGGSMYKTRDKLYSHKD